LEKNLVKKGETRIFLGKLLFCGIGEIALKRRKRGIEFSHQNLGFKKNTIFPRLLFFFFLKEGGGGFVNNNCKPTKFLNKQLIFWFF